jgi:hypothetical protein
MSLESIFICALEHGGSNEKAIPCHTKEDEKLNTVLWYYKIMYFAKVNSDNEAPHSAKQRRSITNCRTSYASVMGWNIETWIQDDRQHGCNTVTALCP